MEIILNPNPILKAENAVVTDEEIKDIVENTIPEMIKIINDEKNLGLGLAAPQVGINKKFFIMRTGVDTAYGLDLEKVLVVFNPEIKKVVGNKSIVFKEGCLSVPNKICVVPRAKEIKVKFTDQYGKAQKLTLKNTDAVVFQHEFDHLNGYEMLDRAIEVIDLPEPKVKAEEEAAIAKVLTDDSDLAE